MRDEGMVLQIEAPGKPVWRPAPVPAPGEGEVLLRLEAITTCPHWDLHIMDGEPMFPGMQLHYPYTPGQPGHEAAGVVEELGPGVEDFDVGQRVVAWRDRGLGVARGCYAQYAPFAADSLLPLPETVPYEKAASLELAMCVQVSFDQLGRLGGVEGRRVGIGGLGPAGLVALQMARAYGAAEVVAFDPLPRRRALAEKLGADRALPPQKDAFPEGRLQQGALDMSIDCTGLKVSVEYLMARTARVVALFGVLRERVEFGFEHWRGDFALLGYARHNRQAGERALDLVAGGRIDLEPLATHALPLSRYAEGVELLRAREAIKIRFLPWAE